MPLPEPEILAKPVQPDAAIAFWQSRAKLTATQAKALGEGARSRAFYVTGLAEMDMVNLVHGGIAEALENGETLADFKKRIAEVIEREGWKGHRVETVFRTSMQSAYSAGRYAKQRAVKELLPYWRYVTVGDSRVRPSHAMLSGKVFPADHPFWAENYPPNGFKCRCAVQALSKGRSGGGASTSKPRFPATACGPTRRRAWSTTSPGPVRMTAFGTIRAGLAGGAVAAGKCRLTPEKI